jgi:hypothetical protein
VPQNACSTPFGSFFVHGGQDIAAHLAGLNAQNCGKFGAQELFRIPEEILVGLMELPPRLDLLLLVPMQGSHHPDQGNPVTGIDQLPIGLLAGILISNPGVLPRFFRTE